MKKTLSLLFAVMILFSCTDPVFRDAREVTGGIQVIFSAKYGTPRENRADQITYTVTVSGAGMNTIKQTGRRPGESIQLEVPAGSARTLQLDRYLDGVLEQTISRQVDVSAGTSTTVELPLPGITGSDGWLIKAVRLTVLHDQLRGTVTPAGGVFTRDTTVTLTASPTGKAFFDGWYVGSQLKTASEQFSVKMSDSITVTALFSVETITMTVQPEDTAVSEGEDLSFSAEGISSVEGSAISYQWQKKSRGTAEFTDIAGASANKLSIAKSGADQDSMMVRCRVSGQKKGEKYSREALLRVNPAGRVSLTVSADDPVKGTVLKNPDKSNYSLGDTVTLTAKAAAGHRFDRWSGSAVVLLTDTTARIIMSENAKVTANFISASEAISSEGPSDGDFWEGSDAQFTVTAYHRNGLTLSYQWEEKIGSGAFTALAGRTSSTLTLPSVTLSMNGRLYRCKISTSEGSIYSSEAELRVTEKNRWNLTTRVEPDLLRGTVDRSASGPYITDSKVILTAVSRAGSIFKCWINGVDTIGRDTSLTVTMKEHTVITGLFIPASEAITLQSGFPADAVCKIGESVSFSAKAQHLRGELLSYQWETKGPSDTGFTVIPNASKDSVMFSSVGADKNGWQIRCRVSDKRGGKQFTRTASLVVSPENRYTLTLTAEGKGTVSKVPDSSSYKEGTSVQINALPNSGWRFVGWAGSYTGTSRPYSLTLDSSKAVTAKFEQIKYSITLESVNGTVSRSRPEPYYYGDTITLTAVPAAGYRFTGWTGDLSGSSQSIKVVIDTNKSMKANFAAESGFGVTVQAPNASVRKTPDKASYLNGESVQLEITPQTGYKFSGWSGDLSGNANPASLTVTRDMNVTANITQLFKMVYTANGADTGTPPVDTAFYEAGQKITVPGAGTLFRTGYNFSGWNSRKDGTGSAYASLTQFTKTAKSDTLFAMWSVKICSVTTIFNSSKGSVTVSPSAGTTGGYSYGTAVTLTAVPANGYSFSKWTGDTLLTSASFTATLQSNKSYSAEFLKNVVLTYNGNGNTVGNTPAAVQTTEGSSVTAATTLSGFARVGWQFRCWNTAQDGSGTNYRPGDAAVMGTSDITLYAQWDFAVFAKQSGTVAGLAVNDNGDRVYSSEGGVLGNSCIIWNPADGSAVSSITTGYSGTDDLDFAQRYGRVLAGIHYTGNEKMPSAIVYYKDQQEKTCSQFIGNRAMTMRTAVSISSDGRYAAVGCGNDTAAVYDLDLDNTAVPFVMPRIGTSANRVEDAVISQDNMTLLTVTQSGGVYCWRRENSSKPEYSVTYSAEIPKAADIHPSNSSIGAVGFDNGTLRLYDFSRSQEVPTEAHSGKSGISGINAVRFAPSGKILATAGNDGFVYIWDITELGSPRKIQEFYYDGIKITSLAFNPSSDIVFAGTDNGRVHLLRLKN